MSNLVAVQNQIFALKDTFQSRLTNQSLNFEAEAGFAVQQMENNDYLLTMATKNPQSVVNAVTNVAAIGVSLNPVKRQAYLVPRGNKVCLDISYIGLVDLATESGSILWAKAELVYEQDSFQMGEPGTLPKHIYNPFSKDRGNLIGVYVVAKIPSGETLCDAMSIAECHAIRDRTDGWKAFVAKKTSQSPWHSDEGEMCKKTVIKRGSKLWPKNERLNRAIDHLNIEMDEGINFNSQSRSSGADTASKALEEKKLKVRSELLPKLEDIAVKEGEQSLNEKLALLNKGQISVIESDIPRLQEMARNSDKSIIEGEKATAQQ
jgi:recombination protein RecT